MVWFRYTAIDSRQTHHRGALSGSSPRDVREKLRLEGLCVQSLEVVRVRQSRPGWRRESPAEIAAIIRELATLTQAGVPLTEAIGVLVRQHKGHIARLLIQIRDRVEQGGSLADAMAELPGAFDTLAVSMVRVGESAGNLEEVLGVLAEFADKSMLFRNRVISALLYPAVVFVAAIGVSVFLMTSVVPSLLAGLTESGRDLPLPTRILKMACDFLIQYGIGGGVVCIAALVGCLAYFGSRSGRRVLDGWLLRLPLIGSLAFRQTMGRTAYVIATLLRSGLELPRAMTIAAETCQNQVIAAGLVQVETAIQSGKELGPAFEQSSIFPPLVVQIFAVGQQSGQLESMLDRLSRDFENQVETISGRLATILEPVAIVFLTGIVGFILLATVLPILEAGNAL
ncbi:MAG: type II secretion system F family protein [Planctomycetaceae bacterium]|nr:type II secretion system F family protein [Planctomycetaceae bacterium]